jgi:Lar family restriction alleviation protein
MSELKPCPFCGTKPHPITADLLTRPCFYYECENKTCHAAEKGWHDTEQEAIDAWNTRPIEEALRTRITELQARVAELEAALDKAAHQLYDYSGSCPSDLYDWEHPNTCIRECVRYDSPDEAWKCWRLWLMCPAPPEDK